jgi:putative ABC transport system permease protein
VVALAVGVGVTVVSAIGPARRAVRVPPVAALASQRPEAARSSRYRIAWGTALVVAGGILLGTGLAKSAIALVGSGAACILFGVTALAPLVARPLSGLIGRPAAALFSVPGKLGRRNSMRSPQRTAQTAAALMIGLAMVSAIAVFGASASKSATSSFDDAVSANLLVSSNGTAPLARQVPAIVASAPGVLTANTIYRSQFEIRGALETLTATSTRQLADTVLLRMTAGTARALAAGQLLIDSTTATADHLAVGDSVTVRFAATGLSRAEIGGIYRANALIGSYVTSDRYFLAHYRDPNPGGVLVHTDGSSSVTSALTRRLAAYPNVSLQTRSQYEKAATMSISQLLNLVYALLGLAVIIALIGIVNTLMLSIFERTREIGLLRAVGLSRRQVRSMVRSEAVILAIFGAVIGIVVGTGLGLALVASLRHQGITEFDVPTARLVAFLVIAAALGLAAAGWPARRAARLDILAAIATE